MLDFWNYKVVTMGRIISAELRHYAIFRGDWSKHCRDILILHFSRWWQPQSLIFKILYFNDPNGQEGWTASLCQISSKSFKQQLIYGYFSIFQDGGRTILDFGNFKILTVGTVKRVELHQPAKFHQNRWNHGWDRTIFRFFQDDGRPPSWMCNACVGTTHEGHLTVFITVRNLAHRCS